MNIKKYCIGLVVVLAIGGGSYNVVKKLNNNDIPQAPIVLSTSSSGEIINAYDQKITKELEDKYNKVKDLNRDIIGYIYITGTHIDYPICSGGNTHYLNYNYRNEPSKSGSIFLDENQLSFSKMSLIHGHNMLNTTMFSDIAEFADQEFFDSNMIYIYDGETCRKFKPVCLLRVPDSYIVKYKQTTGEEVKEYLAEQSKKSIVTPYSDLTENDGLILNTCVSDGSGDHRLLMAQEVTE